MNEKKSIPISINPDFESPKPFMAVNEAAAFSGLGRDFLRKGCKAGFIPHIMSGNKPMINMKKLVELDETAKEEHKA